MKKLPRMFVSGFAGLLLVPALSLAQTGSVIPDTVDAQTETTGQTSSDSSFLGNFIRGSTSGNEPLLFDMQQFRSHPCFSAVGEELDYCLQLFGIQSDFENMVEQEEISRLVLEYVLGSRCANLQDEERAACLLQNTAVLPFLEENAADLDQQLTVSLNTVTGALITDDTTPEMSERDERDERARRLWDLCEDHHMGQPYCYQDYLRFVTDLTIPMDEFEQVLENVTDDADQSDDAAEREEEEREAQEEEEEERREREEEAADMNDTDTTEEADAAATRRSLRINRSESDQETVDENSATSDTESVKQSNVNLMY